MVYSGTNRARALVLPWTLGLLEIKSQSSDKFWDHWSQNSRLWDWWIMGYGQWNPGLTINFEIAQALALSFFKPPLPWCLLGLERLIMVPYLEILPNSHLFSSFWQICINHHSRHRVSLVCGYKHLNRSFITWLFRETMVVNHPHHPLKP